MEEYFYNMIYQTRHSGEVILYRNILTINNEELDKTKSFLEVEYNKECIDYPYTSPDFCPNAAIWAAKLFYYSSQLLLYRDLNMTELSELILSYEGQITASAILSADLLLRFVPDILNELKAIDDSDPLITKLEEILVIWHYSAIVYDLPTDKELDFSIIDTNPCLKQKYIDRVIEARNLSLAKHVWVHPLVQASLGLYADKLWIKFE